MRKQNQLEIKKWVVLAAACICMCIMWFPLISTDCYGTRFCQQIKKGSLLNADSCCILFRDIWKCKLPLSPAQSSDVGYSADALPSLNPRTQKFTDSVNTEIHLSVSMKGLSLEVESDFIIVKPSMVCQLLFKYYYYFLTSGDGQKRSSSRA